MEKLTQFVSKSFENNNNRVTRPALNLKTTEDSVIDNDKDETKSEKSDSGEENTSVKPKNWLISNLPKPAVSYGMDLRVNTNGYPVYGASSELQNYDQNCEKDVKEKLWYGKVKSPVSPRNCCCNAEQDDSEESNYDSKNKKIIENNFNNDEDKNNGKFYKNIQSIPFKFDIRLP